MCSITESANRVKWWVRPRAKYEVDCFNDIYWDANGGNGFDGLI
jgi:hypothetical protein